jgi:hypothetical protein
MIEAALISICVLISGVAILLLLRRYEVYVEGQAARTPAEDEAAAPQKSYA